MVKPKSFRPWNPEQTLLLPPSPVDWLPENHLVFFLLDLAAELDLEAIHSYYRQKDPRGEKAYEPRMMVVLLLTWTPKPEPMLMRASPPARLGKEKPHESQTPQPRADHPQVAHR